jgi:amino acid transporter
MRWILWFCVGCVGLIAVALGMMWASTGFESLGVEGSGLIAVILTIVFVSALGVALMALIFHSSRSGRDEDVYHRPPDHPRVFPPPPIPPD